MGDIAALLPVSTRHGGFAILELDGEKAESDRRIAQHAGLPPAAFAEFLRCAY